MGAQDGAGGSFTVLRFAEPDVPDVVYIEQLAGAQYLENRRTLTATSTSSTGSAPPR